MLKLIKTLLKIILTRLEFVTTSDSVKRSLVNRNLGLHIQTQSDNIKTNQDTFDIKTWITLRLRRNTFHQDSFSCL